MSNYYPQYDSLIEEAYDLRSYEAIKNKTGIFFTDAEALDYMPLFPTWEEANRKPFYNAIVRHNGKIYRAYKVNFPSSVTLEPQEDPDHYYEINTSEWSEYVSGSTYSAGDRVKVLTASNNANYYISKTDNNTATPTDSTNWYSIGPYKELYYVDITSLQ